MTAKNVKKKSIPGDPYYTPSWTVDQCLAEVLPEVLGDRMYAEGPQTILEPSAGQGVWIKALRTRWARSTIHGTDIDDSHMPWSGAKRSFKSDFELYPTSTKSVRRATRYTTMKRMAV